MTLSDLASLGSFVSGVAVLASLIYFALQIRQSARNQMSTLHHDRMAHIQDWVARIGASRELEELWMRGCRGDDTLDAVECKQFLDFQYCRFLFYQEYFLLHQDGMINEARFKHAIRHLDAAMGEEGTRAAFEILKPPFDPGFRKYVEQVVQHTKVRKHAADPAHAFKAALAAGRQAA